MPSYYKTLGIEQTASIGEIKKAYRQLAVQFHPDKTGNKNAEKFLAIQEAYDVLSDPDKRVQYDAKLQTGIVFNEFEYASLDSIYEKLPQVIKTYREKLKIKDKDISILYLEFQFLSYVYYALFDKEIHDKNNKKHQQLLQQFSYLFFGKFSTAVSLQTTEAILKLQDDLQEHIKRYLDEKKLVGEGKLFCDYPTVIDPKLLFTLEIECSRSQETTIKEAIQSSPFEKYFDLSVSKSSIKINIKSRYFSEDKESAVLNDAQSLTKRSFYKNALLNYIGIRRKQKKHTGSKRGFNKQQKIEAAKLLYNILSGRGRADFLFEEKYGAIKLRALQQGRLGRLVKGVLEILTRGNSDVELESEATPVKPMIDESRYQRFLRNIFHPSNFLSITLILALVSMFVSVPALVFIILISIGAAVFSGADALYRDYTVYKNTYDVDGLLPDVNFISYLKNHLLTFKFNPLEKLMVPAAMLVFAILGSHWVTLAVTGQGFLPGIDASAHLFAIATGLSPLLSTLVAVAIFFVGFVGMQYMFLRVFSQGKTHEDPSSAVSKEDGVLIPYSSSLSPEAEARVQFKLPLASGKPNATQVTSAVMPTQQPQ